MWVKSYLIEHAREDFLPEVFLIPQPIGPSLDNPNLSIQSFHEPKNDLVFRPAVSRGTALVPLNHLGEPTGQCRLTWKCVANRDK